MEIIPCKQATLLICKKQEHSLTLRERFQLYVHLYLCVFCRRFLKQTRMISKEAGKVASEQKLSEEEKRKMSKNLGL
jgi:hypothetical protein